MRRGGALAWTVALLAMIPPAALAYLGSHSRLLGDDYCHIAWGAQHGVLGGLQLARNSWNGSYANYFVQFLFVSNGEAAPAFYSLLTIVIWLIALAWLTLSLYYPQRILRCCGGAADIRFGLEPDVSRNAQGRSRRGSAIMASIQSA
ncbi:MAG: hypothetical protein F4X02_11490 [Chloroflexi bacterium]|nr:hypothetical protein [Chloroflexota bacterium]